MSFIDRVLEILFCTAGTLIGIALMGRLVSIGVEALSLIF